MNEGIRFLNYLHDRKVNELLYINAKCDCIELNNFFPELQLSGVCLKNDALLWKQFCYFFYFILEGGGKGFGFGCSASFCKDRDNPLCQGDDTFQAFTVISTFFSEFTMLIN